MLYVQTFSLSTWGRGLTSGTRLGTGRIRLDKVVELVAMVLPATAAQRRLEGLGRRQVTATVLPVAPESRSEACGRTAPLPQVTTHGHVD